MPAILIGVGGVGGTIVSDVRQRLELRVNAQGDSPAAREQAAQYRFFLVDTKEEPFSQIFKPNERFVIPSGIDKFHVDEKIASWHAGGGKGDPFFAEWWPEQNNVAYRVGDFDEGAGQIRIKGKLAYRIHIAQGRDTVVDAVNEAVRSIRSAVGLGPNQDLHKIPVYIVSSLGGGTGSGIVLTLAKHLRRTLPTYCVLQGVFLLASIAALAPGKADESSIWANTDAALREIDYFQRPESHRTDQPNPFLEWPGAGNRIENREAPFHYIYLFGRENRSNLTLDSLASYTKLVAECLVAETFGDVNELIKGPHSQFVARFIETPEVDGRATSYASAGIAGVSYPVDRITQHLGRRFGARALARAFNFEAHPDAEEAAAQFLRNSSALWNEPPSLKDTFRHTLPDGQEFPRLPKMDDARYYNARRDDIVGYVKNKRREFEEWRDRELAHFILRRTQVNIDAMTGPDGAIVTFIDEQLRLPNGIARASTAIDALLKLIREQQEIVRREIGGDPALGADAAGQRANLERSREQLDRQIGKLPNSFGRLRDRNGREAKTTFVKRVWNQYIRLEESVAIAYAALSYYEAVVNKLETARIYLDELIVAARRLGEQLDATANDDLGANVKDSILSVGILDDTRIVDHHFGPALDQAVAEAGEALIARIITGEHGVIDSLKRKMLQLASAKHEDIHDDFRAAIQKAAAAAGKEQFEREVRKLTIWDAIKIECSVRQQLGLIDNALAEARSTLNEQRIFMARSGNPLVNSERFLLQQFIQRKLIQCKRRADPFWQIDHVVRSEYADQPGLLYPLRVLAYDRRTYDDFVTRENLDPNLIQAIARDIGVEPQHLPDIDGVLLYCREGVAPLFFLNGAERSQLRESAARMSGRNKEIYTDRRFKGKVDPIIAPPVRPEERRKYALALAASLEYVNVNGHENRFQWTRGNGDTIHFKTVYDAMDALADDPNLEAELFAFVDGKLARRTDRERSEYLEHAVEQAKLFQQSADDRERKWWQQTINIINRRLNDAQYGVE